MATLLSIIAFLAAGWWAYDSNVSSRKTYLMERNFRLLGEQSQALTGMIANHEHIFQSIFGGSLLKSKAYSDQELRCLMNPQIPHTPRYKAFGAALCGLGTLGRVKLYQDTTAEQGKFSVEFGSNGKRMIVLDYAAKDESFSLWHVTAEVDIAKMMEKLPMEEIFADLLLSDREGNVIYQKKSKADASDFQFASLKVFFRDIEKKMQNKEEEQRRAKGLNKEQQTKQPSDGSETFINLPAFARIPLGETSYLAFAQAGNPSQNAPNGMNFILAGIVSADKFHAEAEAMPTSLLLSLIGLVLAVFLSLPYLKLKLIAASNPLSIRDILALMFTTLMLVGLVTFGLVSFWTYHRTEKTLDTLLSAAAQRLITNFLADKKDAREQLELANSSCKNLKICERALTTPHKYWDARFHIAHEGGKNLLKLDSGSTDAVTPVQYYHNLDVNEIFWVGPHGLNDVNWSRDPGAVWQRVYLGEREYVQKVLNGSRGWIQPIYSWTSGKNYTVVSQVSEVLPGKDKTQTVAALEVSMPSVMDPVVLPGFGFAVIEEHGRVLFHSDSHRNLRENFFEETGQNEALQGHVLARSSGYMDGQYWGRDRRFYVTSLQDLENHDRSWSLVVYRDKDTLETTNLQALFIAACLFLIYAVLILGLVLFGFVIYPSLRGRAAEWLWPHPKRIRAYWLIVALNVFLLAAFAYLVQGGQRDLQQWAPALEFPWLVLLVAFFFPVLGMLPLVNALVSRQTEEQRPLEAFMSSVHGRSYAVMIITSILVFAMLPAFGFFKVAFDAEMQAFAKFVHFDLIRDLRERERRVQDYYREAGQHGNEESKTRFLEQRLKLDEARDIYTSFPLDVKLAKLKSNLQDKTETVGPNAVFEKVHAWLRAPLGNQVSVQIGGFIKDGANQPWHSRVHGKQLVTRTYYGSDSETNVEIKSTVPGISWCFYWLLAFGGLVLVLCAHDLPRLWKAVQAFQSELFKKIAVWLTLPILILLVVWILYSQAESAPLFLAVALGLSLFSWVLYALPRLVAIRVFFLDYVLPSSYDDADKHEYRTEVETKLKDLNPEAREAFLAATIVSNELITVGRGIIHDAEQVERLKSMRAATVSESVLERLWDTLSVPEKLALSHLANNCFLNSKHPEVEALLQKQLIVLAPDLRIRSLHFRKFIEKVSERGALAEWEPQKEHSAWGQIWRPVVVGLALIGLFLIYTQEELRPITMAILPAVVTALLPQLFSGLGK